MSRQDVEETLSGLRQRQGAQSIGKQSPFPGIPRRLWERLNTVGGVVSGTLWSQLSKAIALSLLEALVNTRLPVTGKSMNNEEFVTCGGVSLNEVNMKTMERRLQPGLFFAGEVLDIDGVTGGFNFQAAWTTGFLAGSAMLTMPGPRNLLSS